MEMNLQYSWVTQLFSGGSSLSIETVVGETMVLIHQ
jgi:hypothetical protein